MSLNLGRFGVWTFGAPKPEQAVEIEKLGYGAIWPGGSPAADLAFVEPILAATDTLQVATGIVNVWTAPAAVVAPALERIAQHAQRIEGPRSGRARIGFGASKDLRPAHW